MISDPVIISLINQVASPIVIAVLAVFVGKQNKRIKKIDDQVSNNHVDDTGNPINMREENDERHKEVTQTLRTINTKIDRNTKKIAKIETGLDRVRDDLYNVKHILPRWITRKAKTNER